MEAIVLAGGLGTRLRGVVDDLPKCLAPVAGRPFLDYLFDALKQYGFSRVVLSVGYKSDFIENWAAGRDWPFELVFAVETEPLGTGGAIRYALGKCSSGEVIVFNGDTFFPADPSSLNFQSPVCVALKPMRNFERYGAVELSSGRITAFHEKAPVAEGLINGGVYAINRKLLDLSAFPEKFSFERDYLEPACKRGELAGAVSDSYFIDIGVPEDFARAQKELPEWQETMRVRREVLDSPAEFLFLDRDGVINRHLKDDYVKSWGEFEFRPGMPEFFAGFAERFRRIVIVTNQRGVGKGLMSSEDLSDIHIRMIDAIEKAGGKIDAILVATGIDDPRRKPAPTMFREACDLFPEIRPEASVMVGDSPSDQAFAAAASIPFIQVNE